MVPHLKGIGSYDADFGPVRTMLQREHIPFVDALDAFDDLEAEAYDVGDGLHPNPAGHTILEAAIVRHLEENPAARAIVLGAPAPPGR
jgi:lysophospholipase L1-like esterase